MERRKSNDQSFSGYVLALILEACIQFQSSTRHVDPLHITAHFLRTTVIAPFQVSVRTVKTSSGFTNLTAELLQEDVVKVMAHLIFGVNAPSPKDKLNLTLNPPSTYARRVPLHSRPSHAVANILGNSILMSNGPRSKILAKNLPDSPNRTSSSTVGGGGLEWGAWFEFSGKDERITNPSLCFLVDIFLNTPTLLPKTERVGLTTSWYPTITLSMEFKNKIPSPSSSHASRTVGLYSLGRFMTPPQGRHDAYVEVWSAPMNIGAGQEKDNWRDEQVCLAIATQMALTLPMEVNKKKGQGPSSKL
ncbi:hypothetical protein CVT26_014981 [Gymnopilus dilepis]|uniref:Uncharacterized protein n=1 Tax=Gymnopilus dilepis TaxID=231916 RepID=A0A409YXQ1_9AGAR|nr:hypothetical protein CVT26_014981 [Gymnopilus dilepis]